MNYQINSFKAGYIDAPRKVTRQQVQALEDAIIEVEDDDVGVIKHHFAPGLYAREMFMPKGTTLTGLVHKRDALVIVVGDVETVIDGEVVRLKGHNTFLSKVGAKRAMYSHEDSWVTGLFVTDETDIEKLENELVEDADKLKYRRVRQKQLESESCS